MPTIKDLIRAAEGNHAAAVERKNKLRAEVQAILANCEREGRPNLTTDEDARVTGLFREQDKARSEVKEFAGSLENLRAVQAEEDEADRDARTSFPTGISRSGGSDDIPSGLRRDQSMRDWARREGLNVGGDGLSFDRTIRGLATGDWRGAELEQRAVTESPLTAGGHLVPTPVALSVIDKARNAARTLQAGVTTVPMSSLTLKYPRLATEAAPAWRTEGAAISDQAMSFDSVLLTARSMAMLVKVSWELFEDADQIDGVIENSFAQQIALELDRVILRGSGTAPEPRGIRNQTGVTVTAFGGTDGAAPTDYDLFIDAEQAVRAANFEPTGTLLSSRTQGSVRKLKEESTGAYLTRPADLSPWLVSNQVPGDLTTGASDDTSEVYVGQWDQALLGLRSELSIRFLTERYADTGEYAFLAHLRGDVQLAQPAGFVVVTGVRP